MEADLVHRRKQSWSDLVVLSLLGEGGISIAGRDQEAEWKWQGRHHVALSFAYAQCRCVVCLHQWSCLCVFVWLLVSTLDSPLESPLIFFSRAM